jgi:hypothetical protein
LQNISYLKKRKKSTFRILFHPLIPTFLKENEGNLQGQQNNLITKCKVKNVVSTFICDELMILEENTQD